MRISPMLFTAAMSVMGANAAFGMSAASCPAPQPASNMTATLSSNFAAQTSLSLGPWHSYYGLHGRLDQELEIYTPADAFIVPSTGLRLKTEKTTLLGHQYTSGQVTTQGTFSQTYGHFEMFAKMPQENGVWPAFWLLAENGVWPPEIDVVEYIYAQRGKIPNPSLYQGSLPATTLHWMDSNGAAQQIAPGVGSPISPVATYANWNTTPALPGFTAQFAGYHKYAVDWRPGSIEWLIDGAPVFCIQDSAVTGQRVPSSPMYMLMNTAIAAGTKQSPAWAGFVDPAQSFPVDFDIAYVSVSQFKDLAAPAPLPLEIKNVTVSSYSQAVVPGQTVQLSAQLVVGNQDLGSTSTLVLKVKPYDGNQYTGIGSDLAYLQLPAKQLKANTTYTVSINYTVPSTLASGIYSIGLSTGYTSGPINGPGGARSASVLQGALMTVK